jgi:hypothetical protein
VVDLRTAIEMSSCAGSHSLGHTVAKRFAAGNKKEHFLLDTFMYSLPVSVNVLSSGI